VADFAKLAQTVKRLIEKNGRNVLVRKRPTAPTDANQPWLGNNDAALVGGKVEVTVKAVIVDYTLTDETSDFVKRGLKRGLVAAASTVQDLRGFTILVDGNDTWEILAVTTLAPADVTLLYEFQLKR
jgi:hypothetical protein